MQEGLHLDFKLERCPLCGCSESENHEKCFHCSNCHYLQCCDCDGEYEGQIKYARVSQAEVEARGIA